VTTEIRMPQWGMAMKEGEVLRWLKAEGDHVTADEPLLEVESAKTTAAVPSPVSGVLTRIVIAAGTTVSVQSVLAVIADADETTAAAGNGAAPAGGNGTAPAPAARPAPGASQLVATPVARKLARELGLDLARVPGSGPGGRIVKEDVEAFAATGPAAPAEPAAPPPARTAGRIPVRGVRKVIAERMSASLRDSAQLTMGRHVVMDEAVELRGRLVASWAADDVRPTYTDLVVAAVSRALRSFPRLNSRLSGSGDDAVIELVPEIHLGLAVATEDGLLVPVIRDADRRSLREIAVTTRALAESARARTLGLDDLSGSTFTVTALGSAGVEWFTPILNPPEVGILGIGAITDELRPGPDGPRAQRRMTLSLTVDHRVVDGAPAGEFLAHVAGLLESPYRMLS
jgi:pyruvate dehydrogenase E2 component (dihydrolipoamide acetyltransferase)